MTTSPGLPCTDPPTVSPLLSPLPTSLTDAGWIVLTAQVLAIGGLAVLLQACLVISATRPRMESSCQAI